MQKKYYWISVRIFFIINLSGEINMLGAFGFRRSSKT
jgi:hypothetical protein